MKCPECRACELQSRRQHHRYSESGLPHVVLQDVEVRRCPECASEFVSIPRIAQLHRAIALALITKRERLTPAEIRYLRKSLGWSQADFAKQLHVEPETANRWESEAANKPMADGYELALRLAVAVGEQIDEYEVGMLKEVGTGERKPAKISLRADKSGWHIEKAAA